MSKIYITRQIPDNGLEILRNKGYELDISLEDRPLRKEELITALKAKPYDAVLCLLTDTINKEVFDAVPTAKIFANYAVGFNNIDIEEAKKRGVRITNTPGALTESVAEHTWGLILALTRRLVESDQFVRQGKFKGWGPKLLLGSDVKGGVLGIVGAGRIGGRVASIAKGFSMEVVYFDVKRNEQFEGESGAVYYQSVDNVLKKADVVSIHVPLLPETKHLITAERLAMMKKTAFIINTSRGPVIDEKALVEALKNGVIKGAGLDVFENEPELMPGLLDLPNVVLTPHTASATEVARNEMAKLAAENLVAHFEGKTPPNVVA